MLFWTIVASSAAILRIPRRPREAQGDPKRLWEVWEAQRGPERPREVQGDPERLREAQGGPERPREAQ